MLIIWSPWPSPRERRVLNRALLRALSFPPRKGGERWGKRRWEGLGADRSGVIGKTEGLTRGSFESAVCVCVSCSVVSDSLRPCNPTGSSVHGILQARILEWVANSFLLQGFFPTQGSYLILPHSRQILYPLSHQGSPKCAVAGVKCDHGSLTLVHNNPDLVTEFSTLAPVTFGAG